MRFVAAQQHDYRGISLRGSCSFGRWMHYPPFTALANVVVQSEHLEQAAAWAGGASGDGLGVSRASSCA